jgi:hypothetical protein
MGSVFGEVCLQAWQQNPKDFGRQVMDLLEQRFGRSSLTEALTARIETQPQTLATVSR